MGRAKRVQPPDNYQRTAQNRQCMDLHKFSRWEDNLKAIQRHNFDGFNLRKPRSVPSTNLGESRTTMQDLPVQAVSSAKWANS